MSEDKKTFSKVVALPEAGEGVTLSFRTRDFYNLQADLGPTHLTDSHVRLVNFDMLWIESYLKHGGKKDGKPHPIDLDQCEDLPMAKLVNKLLDAIFLSAHGQTFEDHVRWVAKRQTEAEAGDGDPLASLNQSSLPDTGPGSTELH